MNKNTKYWIALSKIDRLGPVGIKKLFEHFGSVEKVWHASEKEIFKVEGLRRDAINSFLEKREKIDPDDELKTIKGVKVLTLEDEEYPINLKNIYDPPSVLYYKGEILREDAKSIAIVGTRKASQYGRTIAEKLARELASVGLTVISGLAIGIDTEAHKGALRGNGRTIAVLGSGVDNVYPLCNTRLAKEIEKSGALVSEFPLGTKPDVGYFPRRNRIISGLSLGVIVVEGHYDSGAMITAKLALEQGREVFAVPGNVELDQSKGPHWLIKQGAKLVETAKDILEELKFQIPNIKSQGHSKQTKKGYSGLFQEERKILSVLSLEPKHLDVISVETNLSTAKVSSLLMMMEVKGLIHQLPGKNFVLS